MNEQAHTQARLNYERRNDAFHRRRPLTYEQILAKCALIPNTLLFNGTPIKYLLAQGAHLLKDEPEELYNYYLLEIKHYVPAEPPPPKPVIVPVKRTLLQRFIHFISNLWNN